MFWVTPHLKWLNISGVQIEKSLDELLDSNPIISSRQINRPSHVKDLRGWIKEKVTVEFISSYLKPKTYPTDQLFQKALEVFITDLLSKSHYLFMLREQPKSSYRPAENQFYFPASYYVCNWKLEEGELKYFEMRFLTQKFFYEEFYDSGLGRRHPALVVKCFSPSFFCLVPFSHQIERGGRYKRINVRFKNGDEEYQNAIYGYHFKASVRMLDGRHDLKGRKISNADFNSIVDEVKQISKDF